MAKEPFFVPDSFEAGLDDKTGERLQITFWQGDEEVRIHLARHVVGQFAAHILARANSALPREIGQEDVRPGAVVEPVGREIRRRPDGSVQLKIYLQTDDGVGTLALDLSPETAREWVRELTG